MPSSAVDKPLTDLEQRVLAFIEQKFWTTQHIPTNEVIATTLGISQAKVRDCYKKEKFRKSLIARGVDLSNDAAKGILTPTQTMLANLLLNAHDKTSVRQKLELIGVSSQQYYAWLRQPAFQEYLRKRSETIFGATDWAAYQNLAQLVEEKNFDAIKFFFEMRGIYNPKLQVEVNVDHLLMQIIEIVQKHVTDPETLVAIANDVEALTSGRPNVATGTSSDASLPVGLGVAVGEIGSGDVSSFIDVDSIEETFEETTGGTGLAF